MADGNRALEFFVRTLLSRSCTYELACKTLAHRKLFVLVQRRCSACKASRGTCELRNARSYADQSQSRDLSKS